MKWFLLIQILAGIVGSITGFMILCLVDAGLRGGVKHWRLEDYGMILVRGVVLGVIPGLLMGLLAGRVRSSPAAPKSCILIGVVTMVVSALISLIVYLVLISAIG